MEVVLDWQSLTYHLRLFAAVASRLTLNYALNVFTY